MSVVFRGIDEINERLTLFSNIERVQAGLEKACLIVERAAKQNAPKDEGELARSITSKVEELEGIVYTPLEYAPYVEYGTGLFAEEGGRTDVPWHYQDEEGEWHSTNGQQPQPFLRPALDENRAQIKQILREAVFDD